MSKVSTFFQEVRVELSKVTWPTRQETIRYTLVVIGLAVFTSLFLSACDVGFEKILTTLVLK